MMGLPDMIRPVLPSSTLLSPVINCREKGRERESLKEVARFLGKKEREVREASLKAQECRRQWEASWRWGDHKKKGLKVGVLGHAYILQDPYGGRGMVQKIVKQGGRPIMPENLSDREIDIACRELSKRPYWILAKRIMGCALSLLHSGEVAGFVYITSFGCGPDALVADIISRYSARKGKPFLLLTLDEHTGEAGLVTRVEAFMDMLWRREGKTYEDHLSPHGVFVGGVGNPVFPVGPSGGGTAPITKRTLQLGSRYAPEGACLPLKINLGNFIEAQELGADTVVMAGGVGPCRIGYYSQVQREILQDLGYNLEMLVFEPPDVHWREVWEKVKKINPKPLLPTLRAIWLAWKKACALDALEEKLHWLRPRELNRGEGDALFSRFLKEIEEAEEVREVKGITERYLKQYGSDPPEGWKRAFSKGGHSGGDIYRPGARGQYESGKATGLPGGGSG